MGIDPDYHFCVHYHHDRHDNQNAQVKEEEVVGHPRSFALFDSPARVPRADRFARSFDGCDEDNDDDMGGDNSCIKMVTEIQHDDVSFQKKITFNQGSTDGEKTRNRYETYI